MQAIVDQEGVRRYLVSLTINGDPQTAMVKANTVLVNLLREEYDLTGTKKGCELGDCGSCTILLDGRPVNSCLVLALEADGSEIVTVEGLTERGELDRVQQAFLDKAAVQCGYCTPGMILSAKALLDPVQLPAFGQSLHGDDFTSVRFQGQDQAGVNRAPIQEYGTGAAIPELTPFFGSCKVIFLSQQVHQHRIGFDHRGLGASVYGQTDQIAPHALLIYYGLHCLIPPLHGLLWMSYGCPI